jgi:methylated-DNA-[protein]-cysteine S-methyltransferase
VDIACYRSPIGIVEIQCDNEIIRSLRFCEEAKDVSVHSVMLKNCLIQLDEYFTGRRKTFDLSATQEGTPFRQQVWDALLDIPFGETVSYADIARKIGKRNAARAVGSSCGSNRLWLIVPCHRVVGADGSLTGYAGGIERKKWLLAHEAKLANGGTGTV